MRRLKLILKIFWFSFLAVILLAASAMLLLQTSPVQTYIADRIADKLAKSAIDADISFGKILVKPFNTLVIRDLVVIDQDPVISGDEPVTDTLFIAEYVAARFSLKGLTGESININSGVVRNATLNLVLEDGKNSTNLTRMFHIPERRFRDIPDDEIFHIRDVAVDDIRFTMKNRKAKRHDFGDDGINWEDLDLRDIRVRGRHLRLQGKIMSGELDELSLREKSGYSMLSASGRTRVGRGIALIQDFKMSDPWSNVDIPYYCMLYEHPWDFGDFVNCVRMEAEIRPSRISLMTLGYFAPGIHGSDLALNVSGKAAGTVPFLEVEGIDVSMDEGISAHISGKVSGLPDLRRMSAALHLSRVRFTTSSLDRLIAKWSDGTKAPVLGKYAEGKRLSLNGFLYGRPDNMTFSGNVTSDLGEIRTDLNIAGLLSKGKAKTITGSVGTTDLDVNGIISGVPIRECSLETGLSASIDSGENGSSLTIDSLKVSRLHFNGYDYSGIAATGTLSNRRFNGKLICSDPNLNFMFQGIFSFSGKTSNSLYRFYANIGYADLFALNLDKRGPSRISLQTNANFTRTSYGDILGNVDIAGISLESAQNKYDLGDLHISSFTGNDRYRIRLSSQFAEGSYSGSASITSFVRDFMGVTFHKEIPALNKKGEYAWSGENYELTFRTLNSMDLLSFVAPGLYVAEDTSIKASIDASGKFTGGLTSSRIAYKEQYIKDINLEIDNSDNMLRGEMQSESIYLATVMMRNNRLRLLADDNHVGLEFSYDNQDIMENRGEFVAVGDIGRNDEGQPTYDLRLLPSSVYLNSREWNIYPSEVYIEGKDIDVRNIEFRSGEQSILATGGVSEERQDTLDVSLDRFDISIINPLIGKHFNIRGNASGLARITSPSSERGLLLDFVCDSTGIGAGRLGDLMVRSEWDSARRRFGIRVANSLDGKRNISLSGNYIPANRTIDLKADLKELDLSYVEPFMQGIFSETGGTVSGRFSAYGPLDRIALTSEDARLNDARMRIAFTNVEYTADGSFHTDENGVYFDSVSIRDRFDNRGRVNGGIAYDHFKNMDFNIGIEVARIEAINLEDGDPFYGNLFASGDVSISGPVNNLTLTADASTAGRGNLHIPIASSLNAGTTNLLKFKEPETEIIIDPYEEMMTRLQKQQAAMSGAFNIRLRVATNPEVEAFIEIDRSSGNVLSCRGNGTLELALNPNEKDFDIRGNYTISSGNYHFVALGIAARDFSINEGSTIRFNGDIMESVLDIAATYRTKASLSTLIADDSSVDNRRNVDCGIQITDKLRNPRLAFSIDVPDVNPTVKARIENALSTEDKVQKQFLALLISNNFLPDEQSGGIANNSSVLFSNVTDIMTNQLNNIFQKLSIPLDLGFNYQQTNQGNDVFDVAVSTQLFNNRVIVNGNIGNREYVSGGNSNSDVVGDIDIEIKLDRPGTFRLNLFSHSADQYTNYLDNSQRNGIGITYQQEFNNFGQFVKRQFQSRKKRRESELEDVRRELNEEKVQIKIEKEE